MSESDRIDSRADDRGVLDGTPYRVVDVIGSGGMGTVYAAVHLDRGTEVAVKIVHASLARRADVADRLRLEVQSLAHLAHPNVVEVLDHGRARDGRPFYVMPRLRGATLEARLASGAPLTLAESIGIVRAILSVLAAAHASGIVHRDVKPANVFLVHPLGDANCVKLLDFGIAKVLAESMDAPDAPHPLAFPTHESVLLGTPSYLAPELVAHGATSPAADVYATALVLHTMLSGAHPFAGRTRDAVLRAQLEEMPQRPSSTSRHPIPPALDALIMNALAKDPRRRPRDAHALLSALDDAMQAPPSSEHTTLAARGHRSPAPADSLVEAPLGARPPEPPRGVVAPRGPTLVQRWMGALCLGVGLVGLALRISGVTFSVSEMHDPEAALMATYGASIPGAAAVIRSAAAYSALRHGLLALSALVLAIVGVDLVRGGSRAVELLRLWSWLAILIVIPAIAIDVFALAPRQLSLLDLVGASAGELGAAMSSTFVFVSTAGTALLELGFVLLTFVASRSGRNPGSPS